MEITYRHNAIISRAKHRIADIERIQHDLNDILGVLCEEAVDLYTEVDDFAKFVAKLPENNLHTTSMQVKLMGMCSLAEREHVIHVNHCCDVHGCKYGEDDICPVVQKKAAKHYQCEECASNYQDLEFKHKCINNDGVFE